MSTVWLEGYFKTKDQISGGQVGVYRDLVGWIALRWPGVTKE